MLWFDSNWLLKGGLKWREMQRSPLKLILLL